jgi:NAD(P)-dependent dehydrogenase (short-subunit alcohol dehydrogenase family)
MRQISDLTSMRSRVAAITGGAGHLGRAFAETLAQMGCDICLLDVAREPAEDEAARLRGKFGVRTSAFEVDIADERAVDSAAKHLGQHHGRLDVLINNAAYPKLTVAKDGIHVEDQTLAQWEPNVDVSLRGTFLATRAFVPLLRATKRGVIINIASIYGVVGPDMRLYEGTEMGNPAWYAAAKGGIVQLTRYFATTLAPDIRANCVAPGGIRRDQSDSFQTRYIDRTPLRRMAVEEDLCGALIYFASDLSAYVTGQVLAVDGGWTAW